MIYDWKEEGVETHGQVKGRVRRMLVMYWSIPYPYVLLVRPFFAHPVIQCITKKQLYTLNHIVIPTVDPFDSDKEELGQFSTFINNPAHSTKILGNRLTRNFIQTYG